jgi:hypothetical protein
MKLKSKMLSGVAFLVLALPFVAGAAPVGTFTSDLNKTGQTFYGDGAVWGDGFLQVPPANLQGDKCLQCHQGILGIPDKTMYLRTGHGNMLEKVISPPQFWKGPNGQPYPTTSAGHPIDWTTGKVDLGGFCDVGGFEGQFDRADCEAATACTLAASAFPSPAYTQATCTAAGGQWKKGIWTPATRLADITYLIGPWMSVDAPDTGITGAGLPPNTLFMADGRTYGTCGSCHNAGYKASDYTRPQPFADYPNLPKSAAAGVGGSWVLDGIQCERCHDATNHFTAPNTVTVARSASTTALCSQCHLRAATWEGSANPNAATQPTAFPIGASATNFGSHLIGKQFLNSPHGRFSGAYAQIGTTTAGLYNSHFSEGTCSIPGDFLTRTACQNAGGTWTSVQGGCATCHDVHQTTLGKIFPEGPDEGGVAPLAAISNTNPEPIRRQCGIACHASRANLTTIKHSSGSGTPFEGGLEESCVICHMAKPAGGTGLRVHVFRISTDANYSTFPAAGATTPGICSDPSFTTKDACTTAGKSWSLVANSAPEGTFTNAVWVDIDLACGQCHGGGATGDGAKVLPMTKAQLAKWAKGMHGPAQNALPMAAMSAAPVINDKTVTFKDNSTDAEDSQAELTIIVNWGDHTTSTGRVGNTFTHTYLKYGKFTITHAAEDSEGLRNSEKVKVQLKKAKKQ